MFGVIPKLLWYYMGGAPAFPVKVACLEWVAKWGACSTQNNLQKRECERYNGRLAATGDTKRDKAHIENYSIPLCILWIIWLEQNKTCFGGQRTHISIITIDVFKICTFGVKWLTR
ncbi:hypothetical protein RDI58_002649 [Solanum bulbocastanum]|uniref:Uncharacterized protein n=1 Tax=Solanum bulbocastanum TaxID=147425 RepID=A0AAN8UES2_SOLBU